MKWSREDISLKITQLLLCPHILNPVMWIVVVLTLAYIPLFGWWERRAIEGKAHYTLSKNKLLSSLRFLIGVFITMVVNVVWNYRQKSLAYADYKVYKWFPEHSDPVKAHSQNLQNYSKYVYLKNRLKEWYDEIH